MKRKMLKKFESQQLIMRRQFNNKKQTHLVDLTLRRLTIDGGIRMKDFYFVFCQVIFQPFESRWLKQFIPIFFSFKKRLAEYQLMCARSPQRRKNHQPIEIEIRRAHNPKNRNCSLQALRRSSNTSSNVEIKKKKKKK